LEEEEQEEEEEEKKYTIMVDEKNGGFTGLPAELQKQFDNSGFDKAQIAQHPEQVL
jgi:hypothetical protein